MIISDFVNSTYGGVTINRQFLLYLWMQLQELLLPEKLLFTESVFPAVFCFSSEYASKKDSLHAALYQTEQVCVKFVLFENLEITNI